MCRLIQKPLRDKNFTDRLGVLLSRVIDEDAEIDSEFLGTELEIMKRHVVGRRDRQGRMLAEQLATTVEMIHAHIEAAKTLQDVGNEFPDLHRLLDSNEGTSGKKKHAGATSLPKKR